MGVPVLTCCLALACSVAALAAPAHADPPMSTGACRTATVVRNLGAADEVREGEMHSEPVVIADGTALPSGRVTCEIKPVNWGYADPAWVSETSDTMSGVVTLPPTYVAYLDHSVVLCSTLEIDGAGTFYWDAASHGWSADQGVPCAEG